MLPIGSARASPRPVPQGVRSLVASVYGRARLRVTPGPQLAAMRAEVRTGLADSVFTVQERSNRVGVRLSPLASKGEAGAGRMITEGMPPAAVQLTPEGEPIILLCDAPTTGGYPVVACVASVDFPRCGQLRPRDRVGFEFVGVDEAAQLLRSFRSGLDELLPPVEG